MRALSEKEQDIFRHVKSHYKNLFNQKGSEAIRQSLRVHLETEYAKHPAKGERGQVLPLYFASTFTANELKSYYKHEVHTAWRYLFQKPNPWMSPNASYVNRSNHQRSGSAEIYPEDKENILYLWLAASDSKIERVGNVSFEEMKNFFVSSLALTGRAHNWDDDYDDMKGDKPSCIWGVRKRLAQSVIGNPITQNTTESTLTENIIMQVFREQVIFDNQDVGSTEQTIYSNLQALNYDALEALEEAMEDKFIMFAGDDLTSDQLELLECLTMRPESIHSVIRFAKERYGQHKVQDESRLTFQGVRFRNYRDLLLHMGQNIGSIFYDQVSNIIRVLKAEKAPASTSAEDTLNNEQNIMSMQYELSVSKREVIKDDNPFASDTTKEKIYDKCTVDSPFHRWMQTASPEVIDVLLRMKNTFFRLLTKSSNPDGIFGQDINGKHKPGLIDLPPRGLGAFFASKAFLNENVQKLQM